MDTSATDKSGVQAPDSEHCLARSVAKALAEDPSLEAVTIDRARKTISVATIGPTNTPKVAERISSTFQRVQETQADHTCNLLAGLGECQDCHQPLPDAERRRITIQHEGDKTTIARVTCPTARKFWRWNDIPWPRV